MANADKPCCVVCPCGRHLLSTIKEALKQYCSKCGEYFNVCWEHTRALSVEPTSKGA